MFDLMCLYELHKNSFFYLVKRGGGHPLKVSGDICGLSGASDDELQPSSLASAAAAFLARLFLRSSSISWRSDSVALVAAKVVARPLRLRAGSSVGVLPLSSSFPLPPLLAALAVTLVVAVPGVLAATVVDS